MIDVSEKRNRQLNWLLNFRIRMFVKSAVKDHIVFGGIFLWSRQSGTDFSIFSILNIYLRTTSSYCPYFTFLVKTELGGLSFPSSGREGGVKKFCMMWGDMKKLGPFEKYPFAPPSPPPFAVYVMNAA